MRVCAQPLLSTRGSSAYGVPMVTCDSRARGAATIQELYDASEEPITGKCRWDPALYANTEAASNNKLTGQSWLELHEDDEYQRLGQPILRWGERLTLGEIGSMQDAFRLSRHVCESRQGRVDLDSPRDDMEWRFSMEGAGWKLYPTEECTNHIYMNDLACVYRAESCSVAAMQHCALQPDTYEQVHSYVYVYSGPCGL